MKTTLIVLTLAVLATPLLAAAPTADAVGICSQYTNSRCDGYILCVGYRWDSYGFQCTGYGIEDPCWHCCYCHPLP